jgi:hypothetical protein
LNPEAVRLNTVGVGEAVGVEVPVGVGLGVKYSVVEAVSTGSANRVLAPEKIAVITAKYAANNECFVIARSSDSSRRLTRLAIVSWVNNGMLRVAENVP